MPEWKKNIFVRVVNRRMRDEDKTAEEILLEYPDFYARAPKPGAWVVSHGGVRN